MNARFFIAATVVLVAVAGMVYSAATSTAQSVVTVAELLESKATRRGVRLGARVAEGEIRYTSEGEKEAVFTVAFDVQDIAAGAATPAPGAEKLSTGIGPALPVTYRGVKPDTLKPGRDVILDGDFDGSAFRAKTLVTKCPSKYEPPLPGEAANRPGAQSAGNANPYAKEAS